jgi:hypothetical protein
MTTLLRQPVDILIWANGPLSVPPDKRIVWFREHPFNVGQHVAHNEMLDECSRRGYDWHIRVDDDCWLTTRKWLDRLLRVQEAVKEVTGKYAVMSPTIDGLEFPPEALHAYEIGRDVAEQVEMLGGIFRMSPMSLIRYFRWDERQAMGFGDANQFSSFCESTSTLMLRVRGVRATHGDSTKRQQEANAIWDYEHDMLQHIPLGL